MNPNASARENYREGVAGRTRSFIITPTKKLEPELLPVSDELNP
jgi:hypothetical protein